MDPLRISMVGLSKWESVFVQTTVDLASGVELPPCRFVEDPNGADVLLVDARHQHRVSADDADSDNRPVVVSFAESPAASDGGRGLTRPVGHGELISMLKDIESELQEISKAVQEARPEPAQEVRPVPAPEKRRTAPVPVPAKHTRRNTDPAVTETLVDRHSRSKESLADKDRPARRFVAGTRLLGVLSRLSQQGAPAEVKHPRFPTLLISPEHNIFVSSDNPLTLPDMFRDSAMSFRVDRLASDLAEAVLTSGSLRPLSHLIYSAALFGSEGRLMLNSDVESRLSLLGTPDFDAVPQLPEHMAIARYMIGNAGNLAEIAESTGVSISIVIDFCNACEAIGLIRRASEGNVREGVDESGVTNLLDRVRDLFRDS